MFISGKTIMCFLGRGYNVHFCEENIVCLSEKRIWFVYLRKGNTFLI